MPNLGADMSNAGFADPVHGPQIAFRAVLQALAQPATPRQMIAGVPALGTMSAAASSILLALCDQDTTIWLDPALTQDAQINDFIRFHTGSPCTRDPGKADFAFVSDPGLLPPLQNFAQGLPDYPERSTTIVLQTAALRADEFSWRGPGLKGEVDFSFAPIPQGFAEQWRGNNASFPLGVDLLVVCGDQMAGLPRSLRIGEI